MAGICPQSWIDFLVARNCIAGLVEGARRGWDAPLTIAQGWLRLVVTSRSHVPCFELRISFHKPRPRSNDEEANSSIEPHKQTNKLPPLLSSPTDPPLCHPVPTPSVRKEFAFTLSALIQSQKDPMSRLITYQPP